MLCGIDEAGRGPLAGPVCAAAVVLGEGSSLDDFPLNLLDDSKKLKAKQREEARLVITDKALAWAVAWATHTEIDEINILQASLLAMKRAVEYILVGLSSDDCTRAQHLLGETNSLPKQPKVDRPMGWPKKLETEYTFGRGFAVPVPAGLTAIVDGLHTPVIPIPCTPMVKADAQVREVMAASILAKTARDQLMEHYATLYPQYGYEGHKGYPTPAHKKLVHQYGPSPIQRKTFKY